MSRKNLTKVLFISGVILSVCILVILGIILFLDFLQPSLDRSVPITPIPIAEEHNASPTNLSGYHSLIRIEGTVVDENGSGFANVSIEAGSGESKISPCITSTDSYGRFVVSLAPGSYQFTASSTEAIVSSSQTVQITSPVDLQFSLARKSRIAGIVLKENGESIDGAQISLSAIRNPDQLKAVPAASSVGNCTYSTHSDASGQFDFFPIWPGRYALKAQAQGFLPYENFDIQTVTEPQTIVLRTKGDIRVTVLDDLNEPVFLAAVNFKSKILNPAYLWHNKKRLKKANAFLRICCRELILFKPNIPIIS